MGLMGGSLGLSLRQKGIAREIVGVEARPEHAQKALERGLADRILPLEQAIAQTDLLVLATPVNTLPELALFALDRIGSGQVLMDLGSTKAPLARAVAGHPARGRLVATHPMAGTEYSGPEAAVEGLFEGKMAVLCNPDDSDADALARVRGLYEALGMRLTMLDAVSHDLHAAYVSHISHISSFALAITVLEKERDENRILELAGGGFSSTVRLAKSNPATWIPIFEQNRDHVLDVLDEFINTVSRFRTLLIKKDFETFYRLIERANDIQKTIR